MCFCSVTSEFYSFSVDSQWRKSWSELIPLNNLDNSACITQCTAVTYQYWAHNREERQQRYHEYFPRILLALWRRWLTKEPNTNNAKRIRRRLIRVTKLWLVCVLSAHAWLGTEFFMLFKLSSYSPNRQLAAVEEFRQYPWRERKLRTTTTTFNLCSENVALWKELG